MLKVPGGGEHGELVPVNGSVNARDDLPRKPLNDRKESKYQESSTCPSLYADACRVRIHGAEDGANTTSSDNLATTSRYGDLFEDTQSFDARETLETA